MRVNNNKNTKKVISWILVFSLIVPLMQGMIFERASAEDMSEVSSMFSYEGSKNIYVGETINLSLYSMSGQQVKWSASDSNGQYCNWYTNGNNNTGTTFILKAISGTDEGADVTIRAESEINKCYQEMTIKIFNNDKFYFTSSGERITAQVNPNDMTAFRVDLSVGGQLKLGNNQKQNMRFSNNDGYLTYIGNGEAGYEVTNDAVKETTTNPDNPVYVDAAYDFTDDEGEKHSIHLRLDVHVVDALAFGTEREFSMNKGTDSGPNQKQMIVETTNLSTTITWKAYRGRYNADEIREDMEVTKEDGFEIIPSTSGKYKGQYADLHDVGTISISKDLSISRDASDRTFTVIASQLINGETLAKNAICYVNVLQPVTELTLSNNDATLFLVGEGEVGNNRTVVTASVVGDFENSIDPDNKSIIWTCTDTEVADIVVSEGEGAACTIVAKRPGNCVVVAASRDNPAANDVIYVSVCPRVSSVQITSSDMTVNLAEQFVQLFANVQSNAVDEQKESDDYEIFENALNTSVTWSSSNEGVATVDMHTGKVSLKSAGRVTITCASTDDQAISDSVVLTINVPVAAISLQDNHKKISVGESFTLNYTLLSNYPGFEPSNKEVTWESSDSKVATVDNDGKVTGVMGGTATILIRADEGQITATCTVEVYQAVTRIDISDTTLELNVGGEAVLETQVYPLTASEQTVTWSSNKPDVVSVTQDGVVTAKKVGDPVVITAYIEDKDATIKATCIVNVVVPITSIQLSPYSKTMSKGETFAITKKVTPSNATNASVVYSSTDPSVATVDSGGNVTAVSGGTCYITARTVNRDMLATVFITVDEKINNIVLSKTKKIMKKGSKYVLIAAVTNSSASNKGVVFKSSNSKVVSVSQKGIMKAKRYGTAKITCSAMDGSGVQAVCKVNVRRYVDSIKLNHKKMYVQRNKKSILTATVSPKNADVKKLKWKSSNNKVATVNKDGVVKGLTVGSCYITCKATDGSGKKARCKIYVKKKLTNDEIKSNKVSVN